MRDLYNNIQELQVVDPDTPVADLDSEAVDMQGYESLVFLVSVGDTKDAGFAVALEDSPDNAVWTAVAAGLVQGPDTALAVDTASKYGYLGIKRYVRVALTIPGATDVGVVAVKNTVAKAPTE